MNQLNILEKKIKRLGELEENWDGYGASSIPQAIVKNALTFLRTIGERDDLVEEDISPTPYGSITIDLSKVSVEIGIKQIGWFSFEPEGNDSLGEDTNFINLPEKLKELL